MFKIFTILPRNQYVLCMGIFLAMIVGAVLEAIGVGAILPLISIIGDTHFLEKHSQIKAVMDFWGIRGHEEFIILVSLLMMIIYWVKNIYIAWETKLQVSFSMKNQIYYSRKLFSRYLRKKYMFHVDNNSAVLIRNVNSGAESAFNNILVPFFQLMTELFTAFMIWLMLVAIDSFTAVVVAGVLGVLMICILRIFRKRISCIGRVRNDSVAKYMKWLNQGLGAIKETKVMQKETYFEEEFSRAYNEYGIANGMFLFVNQLPRSIIESTMVSGLLLLIVVKTINGENPSEIVPLLGVLALAAFRMMPSVNRIINYYNQIRFYQPLFNQIYEELYAIRQEIESGEITVNHEKGAQIDFLKKISIHAVSFSFSDGKKVLNNINFDIPKGSFVGIIGSSGAGKTTFVDILLGLLHPTTGNIYVDGINIDENIYEWQKKLAYVPQSIYLIDGTIKENIALGTKIEDIDKEKLDKALKMAELTEYIDTLSAGVNTKVGERGVKLSGGQRQRIGIARALYQQPQVLILDEATSALDVETERNITDTILKLKGEITIIAIAHRVSTLEQCDFKVKFDGGNALVMDGCLL